MEDWEIIPVEFGHYNLRRKNVAGGIYFRKEEIRELIYKLIFFEKFGEVL